MPRTVLAAFNEANPNKVADLQRLFPMGEAMRVIPKYFRGTVSANVLTLPEEAKAVQILRANSLAGTLAGNMIPQAPGVTPTTGQSAVNLLGNIAFAGADVVTSAEVWYVPLEGQIFEESVVVTSNVGALPFTKAAVQLISVTATAGAAPGAKTILARAAAPSAGQASLTALGTAVTFNGTDAITRALVRYVAAPGVGVSARPSLLSQLLSLIGW